MDSDEKEEFLFFEDPPRDITEQDMWEYLEFIEPSMDNPSQAVARVKVLHWMCHQVLGELQDAGLSKVFAETQFEDLVAEFFPSNDNDDNEDEDTQV